MHEPVQIWWQKSGRSLVTSQAELVLVTNEDEEDDASERKRRGRGRGETGRSDFYDERTTKVLRLNANVSPARVNNKERSSCPRMRSGTMPSISSIASNRVRAANLIPDVFNAQLEHDTSCMLLTIPQRYPNSRIARRELGSRPRKRRSA